MAGGAAKRVAFSFVADVRARDYTVTIDVAGQDPLAVTRLGRRADEFAALLGERLRRGADPDVRLPRLAAARPRPDGAARRRGAAARRRGGAGPRARRDPPRPQRHAAAGRDAARPARGAVAASPNRADLAIGFKQVTSVRRAAVGVTPWRDPSATPHIGEHETPGGRFGAGLGGVMAAGVMAGLGPGGGLGGYGRAVTAAVMVRAATVGRLRRPVRRRPRRLRRVRRLLGVPRARRGLNWNSGGGQHQMTPRADVRRGLLTPETEDLAALTTSGADPTVLAFALLTPARGGDPVAYEVLNLPEPVTYVYRAGGPDPRALVNQALDDAGFAAASPRRGVGRPGGPHRQDAATSPLARALVAAVPHDPGWLGRSPACSPVNGARDRANLAVRAIADRGGHGRGRLVPRLPAPAGPAGRECRKVQRPCPGQACAPSARRWPAAGRASSTPRVLGWVCVRLGPVDVALVVRV